MGRTAMDDQVTRIAGIVIPSTSPLFLSIVAGHILIGLLAVLTGAAAMLTQKGTGSHARFGTLYVWSLLATCTSATALSLMRWPHTWHLFLIGAVAVGSALLARTAARGRRRDGARAHLVGMACSYVLLLVAFYIDNGPQLPLWRVLPPRAHWLIPSVVGVLLTGWALVRHPLTRPSRTGR